MLKRLNDGSESPPTGAGQGGAGQGAAGRLGVLALEPRFMFDAAGVATAAETIDDPPPPEDPAYDAAATAENVAVDAAPALGDAAPAPGAAQNVKNVVFVDASVNDYQTLIQNVGPDVQVVLLDAGREALAQMADALSGLSDLDSVQVVSHGGAGHLYIAGRVYWASGLDGRAAELQSIGAALRPGGDILFYGCNVGAGEAGRRFVETMHRLTGADVAVSNDGTGNGEGKNWVLETQTGAIEASSPFSASSLATFSGSLQTRTVTLASGTTGTDKDAGSLNYQITNAADGDVIVFAESLKNATVSLGVTTSLLTVSGKGITLNGDVNGDGIADVVVSGKGDGSATSTIADYRGLAFNAADKTSTVKNLIFERFYGSTALQGAVTLQGGSLVVDGAIFRNNLNNAIAATANSIDLTVKNSILHHNSGIVTGIGAFSAIRSFGAGSLTVENTVVADNTYTMNCGSNSPTYPGGIISHIRTTTGAATVNIRNNTIINNTIINNDAQGLNIKTAAIGIYSLSSGATANIYNNIIMGNSGSNGGTAFADANSINYNSDNVTLNSDKNHFGSSETVTAKFVDATNSNLALRDYRPHADATDFINKGNSSDANYYGGSYDIRGIDRIRDGLLDLGAYEVRWNAGAPDLDLGGAGKNTAISSTDPSAGVTVAASAVTGQTDSDTRLLGATITLTGIADTGKESLSLDAASARAYGIAGTLSNSDTTLTLTGAASLADYQAVLRLVQYKNTETVFTDGDRTVTFTVHDGETASTARTSTITLGAPVLGPTVTGVTSSTANGSYKVGDTVSVQVTFSESVDVTGTPQLTLETGTTDRAVNYVGGSGTATLTFTYTVQAGDTSADLDYQATTALALNGGAIVATSGGAAASLTLAAPGAANSLGNNKAIVIDTTAPTASVTAATVKNTDSVTTAQGSETGTVYLVKSGATVTDKASLDALAAGNTANSASITTANADTAISAAGLEDGTYYVYVVDAVGNVSAASSSAVTIDSTAPTLGATDTASVAENSTTVKTVSATDASAVAYSIVAGNDGAKFSIDASTGALTFTAAPDYESPTDVGGTAGDNVYIVTVRATDAAGNTADQTLTVTVTNINEAPTATDDTGAATEKGGTANGSGGANATGNVLTNDTDPDSGATLTVTAVRTGAVEGSGTAGTVGQSLTGTYGSLTLNADGSYTYVVDDGNATVQALKTGGTLTDSFNYTVSDGALTDVAALTITVNGAYDAPTDIALSANGVSTYDSGTDVKVGTLSTTDVDSGDTFTYAIVSAADPSSNDVTAGNLFDINGADLRAANPSALAQGTYTLVVRATDGGNLTYDKTLTVTVSDTLIVTTASDSGDDAQTDATYAAALADGGGLSLREALFLAQAGGKTIGFAAGLDGLTITLGSNVDAAAGTTFLLSNSSLTIASGKLNLAGDFTVNAGSGYTLTIDSTLGDAGAGTTSTLTKTGTGTLVLGGTNNVADTGLSAVSVSEGVLSAAADAALGEGTITLAGGTLAITGATEIDNAVTLTAASTITSSDAGATVSGNIGGAFALTVGGSETLTLSGTNSHASTAIAAGALRAAGSGQLGSGAVTLSGGGLTVTGAAAVTNALTLTADGTLTNAGAAEWSGLISGGFALTKDGAGALTLSNAGNAAGATTLEVKAGAVSAASDDVLVGGAVTLNGGGLTISAEASIDNAVILGTGSGTVTATAAATLSGVISGAGNLTKAGTAALTLTGNNTFSGSATVAAGTLIAAHDNALGTTDGATVVSSGAALGLKGGISTAEAVSAAGTGVSSSGAVYNVSGNNALTGAATLTAATTVGVGAGALTIGGSIGGAFALTKTGSETLTLSGTNAAGFTTLAVSAGALSVASDDGLGSGAVTLAAGTTLQITGATTIDNAVTLGGDATVQADAAATLSGVVSGAGFGLTKTGTATLTLTGDNTYTGTTTVSTGTLTLDRSGGAMADDGAVVVASGATLALSADETIGSLAGAGTTTLGANTLTVGGTGSTTYSGTIGGAGGLTKSGTGTLTLSGTNTYTGATVISAGALALSGGSALADASAVTVNGTLSLSANETVGALSGTGTATLGAYTLTVNQTTDSTFSGVVGGTGGLTKTGTGTLTLSGDNAYVGATTISAGGLTLDRAGGALSDATAVTAASGATLTLNQSDAVGSIAGAGSIALGSGTLTAGGDNASTEFSGVISGTGGNLVKTGTGTLTLSGNNAYTGTTTIQGGGALSVASDGNLGSGALTIDASTLATTGATDIDNAITLIGAATVSNGAAATLSGVISGAGSLVKTGTGALTLAGVNVYAGATTAAAGTLHVTGALNGTSAATVAAGATLSGTGSVFASSSSNALTVDAGGFLAPGTVGTAGRLTINGALVLNGTLKLDLAGTTAGTGYDQVAVYGTVTLGATSAFDAVYSAPGGSNNTFVVIDNNPAGAVTGTVGGATAEGGLLSSNGRQYKISYVGGSGNDVTLQDNSPPVFTSSAPATVNEDSGYSYTATVVDGDGDAVTLTATTLPSWLTFGNGVLSGVPGQGDVGTHTVVLSASDGKGGTASQTFSVTVNAVNDAPSINTTPAGAVDEKRPYSYTIGASDEEGEALTFAAVQLPSWLTFSNGVLSGTPGQGDVGTHTVTLTATDASGAVAVQTFTVTVNAVNDPPVFTSTPPTSANEDATYAYRPTATDEEGRALTFAAVQLPSWLTFSDGVLSGTPGQGDVGTHTVTLTATDADGAVATQTFTVAVVDVNDAPVFTSTPPTSVNERTTYVYRPAATDEEGRALTFAAVGLPSWLTFSDGVLSGAPGQGDVGTHTVTLTATDADGAVATQTFTVAVVDVNDAPVLSIGPAGPATVGLIYALNATATDPDGPAPRFEAIGLPSWLTLTDDGAGRATLTGAPGAGDVGTYTATLRAVDANGAATTQTFTITVAGSAATAGGTTGETAGTAATLNITQNGAVSTASFVGSATAGPTTAASLTGSATSGGAGGSAGAGATTVAVTAGGSTAGGTSSGPGGAEVGRDSPATVRVGNVDGNTSSATGIQQTQGLTTTATSADASASADGSTLVRNAARGDAASNAAFYGASTVLSLNNLGGGTSPGGFGGGFGASAGGFGASAGGFGASAGGSGGGVSGGSVSGGSGQPASPAGTGNAGSPASGPVQGRPGGETPAGQNPAGQNPAAQGQQNRSDANAPRPTPNVPQGDAGRGAGNPPPAADAPAAGGEQPAAPTQTPDLQPPGPQTPGSQAPGPQTGVDAPAGDGLFRGQWAIGPQGDDPAPLPGRGLSERLAHAHTAFDRQTARLAAAAAALRSAA